MRMMTTAILSVTLAGFVATSGHAGLRDERDITAGLLAIAVADKIRRSCDDVSGRLWVARSYLNGLKAIARERGYSEAEIDAHVNSSENKAEMRKMRNAYYKSKGASNLDHPSLCRLAREEVAAQTQAGKFLKVK
ncbi:DUF5333 domain-containing protein [Pseudohalocynthiibacter aestuariivivens]|uniref:DUF5333 domain-containing protein n=1 Tax=Roseovarius pelagicus TaxID=2980108 RepID=A0ABY6DD20_9RHOB|nr:MULTISPECIES: DUF5333 domain-containing protein [Rhodobacterales]QIE44129.1 DUF5333 domain-containing protein [Pseudohalocynthiibacter aestuariivivens]UXX83965.1 DUF5333 domain-containing protein [Roseovarius pelagicus]